MAQLARLRMEAEGGKCGPDAGLLGTSPAVQIVGSLGSRSTASADGVVLSSSLPIGGFMTARPPMLDDGISGKPFVRVEPTSRSNRSSGVATPDERALKTLIRGRARGDSRASARARPAAEQLDETAEIPVGISRLHMVSLPELQMKPIYWSPVNDIATVLRATWFYRWAYIPFRWWWILLTVIQGYHGTRRTRGCKSTRVRIPRAPAVDRNLGRRAQVCSLRRPTWRGEGLESSLARGY